MFCFMLQILKDPITLLLVKRYMCFSKETEHTTTFNKVRQGKSTIGFLYLLGETSLLHPKNMSFLYSYDQFIIKQS